MPVDASIETPERVAKLPTHRGFPVPWFVAWVDGVPDFRIIAPDAPMRAHRGRLCWICGEPMGSWFAYVAGPMCAVNRTSSEPPSHRDCALYAAKACPFLSRPHAKRREDGMPAPVTEGPGIRITRNPGVAMVWVGKGKILTKPDAEGRVLWNIGEPAEVIWYAEGRLATREEVEESIDTGLPILRAEAEKVGGPLTEADERQLAKQTDAMKRWLPDA